MTANAAETSASDAASKPTRVTDTTGWYQWAFDSLSPEVEAIDLSHLNEKPAGGHGFLKVSADGHLQFEDGEKVRFFGTSFGGSNCCPDKKTAEVTAERLAKFGMNLARFHCPDTDWSPFIDYKKGNSRELNPEALDRYDDFFAQLKKQGIYVYFDLLDYRQFMPGDGVKDADQMDAHWVKSMKAASMFDARMLELQKEYATKLLTHKNPYTGLRYVDDPALMHVEITNENNLFYINNSGLLLPSYWEDLRNLWNDWLVQKYANREGLAKAWTNAAGECALASDEDPATRTVKFPNADLYKDLRNEPYTSEKSPARMNAMTRFLYEKQVAYFKEMMAHLKTLDVKCPITGTNQDWSDASNAANAVCETMTRNNYWNLAVGKTASVFFGAQPLVRANLTKQGNNPIVNVASSSVAGKPMVMPEMNFPWPNEWRSECLPLMASYMRLQDWDGIVFFNYEPMAKPLVPYPNNTDPVRWSQVPLAALIIRRGDIASARNMVHVGVSDVDLSCARPHRTTDRYSPYRVFAYITKVRNTYFDTAYEGDADIVVSSGHSAVGDYSKAKRAIVFADSPFIDELATKADRGLSARQTNADLKTEKSAGEFDTAIAKETIPEGAKAYEAEGMTVGYLDDTRLIYPSASSLDEKDPAWLHRLYLEAANRWGLPGAASADEAGKIYRSDTGELVLDNSKGLFTGSAPNVAMVVGSLAKAGKKTVGPMTVNCHTAFASINAISLDGKPLEQSEKILITAAARAENTGQVFAVNTVQSTGPQNQKSMDFDADRGIRFTEGRSEVVTRGGLPILVEPVDATIALSVDSELQAYPLGPKGEKREALQVSRDNGRLMIETKDIHTPWILLESRMGSNPIDTL